jgi:hypothetical protein
LKRLLEQGRAQAQCTRTANTCANLLKLWTFLGDLAVPPTNNEAERALRALVLKRRITGNWLRVFVAAEFVCEARRCWIVARRAESSKLRSFEWSKWRKPSNGNGYQRF